jgi:hypothetical protein
MAIYGPCLKVGEFLLPSGLIAIGRDGHIAGSGKHRILHPRGIGTRWKQPGRGDLCLAETLLPDCGNIHERVTARAIFPSRHRHVSGGHDGLVGAIRKPAAPVRFYADPDARYQLQECLDRRSADFDAAA